MKLQKKINYIKRKIQQVLEGEDQASKELKQGIVEGNIAHTVEWKVEDAVYREALSRHLRARVIIERLEGRFTGESGDASPEEQLKIIVSHLEHLIQESVKHLTGYNEVLGGGGRGPWTPSSTSSMANAIKVWESNARREVIMIADDILKVLTELDKEEES